MSTCTEFILTAAILAGAVILQLALIAKIVGVF